MLADVVDVLRCPVCEGLVRLGGSLRCGNGHSFDVARQGYVNLQTGAAAGNADTADMVAARAEHLAAGHYDRIVNAVAAAAAEVVGTAPSPLVVDAGAGTGHWLATLLDEVDGARGLALDNSKYAARRAAQAHSRIGAVVCDTWGGLPVAGGVASVILNVFAPRNGAEFARVLRPDGTLIVVTPTTDHLAEVVTALGMLRVDESKDARLDRTLSQHFDLVDRETVSAGLELGPDDARRIARMGPSTWHLTEDELDARLPNALPIRTTASVAVSIYRPS